MRDAKVRNCIMIIKYEGKEKRFPVRTSLVSRNFGLPFVDNNVAKAIHSNSDR